MLNRFLADTYNIVRTTAQEVRLSVSQNAARARQALGLSPKGNWDAVLLQRQLEQMAAQTRQGEDALPQLYELYVRWVAQLLTGYEFTETDKSGLTVSAQPPLTENFQENADLSNDIQGVGLPLPHHTESLQVYQDPNLFTVNRMSPATGGPTLFQLAATVFRDTKDASYSEASTPAGDICSSFSWIAPSQALNVSESATGGPSSPPSEDIAVPPNNTPSDTANPLSATHSPHSLPSSPIVGQTAASDAVPFATVTIPEEPQPDIGMLFPSFPGLQGLTFREVFLRSQALERALIGLARSHAQVRAQLLVAGAASGVGDSEASNDGEDDLNHDVSSMRRSARGVLLRLMQLTLRGTPVLHQQILCLLCTLADTQAPSPHQQQYHHLYATNPPPLLYASSATTWELHLRHIIEIVTLLKFDWTLEALLRKKRLLAAYLQRPDNRISGVGPASVADAAGNEEPKSPRTLRVSAIRSRLRAEATLALRYVDHQLCVRERIVASRLSARVFALQGSVEKCLSVFRTLGSDATARHIGLTSERQKAIESASANLEAALHKKTLAKTAVVDLENKRDQLLAQLAAVETQLETAHEAARLALRQCDLAARHHEKTIHIFDQRAARSVDLQQKNAHHQTDMEHIESLIGRLAGFFDSAHLDQYALSTAPQIAHQALSLSNQVLAATFKSASLAFLDAQLAQILHYSNVLKTTAQAIDASRNSVLAVVRRQSQLQQDQRRTEQKSTDTLPTTSVQDTVPLPPSENSADASDSQAPTPCPSIVSIEAFNLAQIQLIDTVRILDTLWKEASDFVEAASTHLTHTTLWNPPRPSASPSKEQQPSSTSLSEGDNEDPDYLKVSAVDLRHDESGATTGSSFSLPSTPPREPPSTPIQPFHAETQEFPQRLSAIHTVYSAAKGIISSKPYLLDPLPSP